MSIGAWALLLFGGGCFVSFVATFWPEGWLGRLLQSRPWGLIYHVIGCLVGFFIAAYTGVLLSASNQPVWSQSEWIGALFLTSAASTGMAAVLLLNHWRRHEVSAESLERLEQADLWALGLELAAFAVFLASTGGALVRLLETWPGQLLVLVALPVGILIPLAVHLTPGLVGHWRAPVAAVFSLVGGLVLRYGIVMLPPALLRGQNVPEALLEQPLWTSWQGVLLLGCTALLALLVVLGVWRRFHLSAAKVVTAAGAALVVTAAVLFYVGASPDTLRAFHSVGQFSVSPEDGRQRGGGVGASSLNRPHPVRPRSKIPENAWP
jgi:formate-dependent nitrite reductase membrane component NrfD